MAAIDHDNELLDLIRQQTFNVQMLSERIRVLEEIVLKPDQLNKGIAERDAKRKAFYLGLGK